jgi:hypothetical protein
MSTARFRSIRLLPVAGLALAIFLGGGASPSSADDSDIFRFRATPNVLIIVDDSGSMARTYGGTEVGDLDGQTRAAFGGTGTQTSSRVDVAYRVLYQLLNGDNTVPAGLASPYPTQRSHVSPVTAGTDGEKFNLNLTRADEDAVKLRLGLMIYGPSVTWPSSGSPTFSNITVPVQINGTDNNLPPFNTSFSSFWNTGIKNNLTPGNNPTPMARSLEAARRRYFPIAAAGDGSTACRKKFVVLITDGEDTNASGGSGNVPKYYGPGGSQPDQTTDTNYGKLGANFNANGYAGSTNTGQIARNTESISQAKLLADDNVILFVVGIGMKRDGAGNDVPHLKVLRQVLRRMAEQRNIDLTSAEYSTVASSGDNTAIGAGKAFFADDATELLAALQQAFDTIVIQAYSFTAPVVPAVRTTDSNRLYLSTFRPDNPPETFWEGACKSINLNADGSVPSDLDAAKNWDAGTGLNSLDSANRNYSANPRKVYTASVSGSTWTREAFSTSNGWLDNNVLSVPSAEKNNLIDEIVLRSSRPKRLGDIYHSTPVVVGAPSQFFSAPGFSSAVGAVDSFRQANAQRQRVIYAGSNDGMLHGFNAGTWDTSATPKSYNAGTGEELFAYIPKNLLPVLKNMKVTTTSTHQYMVDSSPKAADVWLDRNANNVIETPEWKTVIVTGERKGGRGLFALDITSPQYLGSSNYPVPLWEIDDTVLANLGQTWSEPLIGRVKIREGLVDKDRWVAFVGGGYWPNTTLSANAASGATSISVVDSTGFPSSGTGILSIGTGGGITFGSASTTSIAGIPASGSGSITTSHSSGEIVSYSSIGRGFYVVDILLGKVIWKLEASSASDNAVRYPMTSSPAGVDSDSDGYLNYVYITDLGGQLWRFDVGVPGTFDNTTNLVTAGWSGKRIFSAPTAIPQRAFNKVEVGFDAGFNRWIFFGTGEREKPENPGTGRFYAIRDGNPSSPYTESDLSNFTSVIANTDNTVTGTVTPTQNGWFAVMPNTNEKILSDAVLFNDVLFFTTFKSETTNLCGGGGDARLYGLRTSLAASTGTSNMSAGAGGLLPASGTARVRSRLLDSGGIPSSPVVSMSVSGAANLYVGTTNAARVQSFTIDSPTTFKRLRRWKETIGQ